MIPENQLRFITKHFNDLIIAQSYPQMKHIKVVPVPKPNKNPSIILNYRPIALINTTA